MGRDGRIEGLDIDLLEGLRRRTGVQFEVRRQPGRDALGDVTPAPGRSDDRPGADGSVSSTSTYLQPAYRL